MASLDAILHPPIEPHATGMLRVSELHSIHWEVSGNPEGRPVLVIHGGPGGGSQPDYRRYFDPAHWRIIQFDQRGCGKSTPWAELEDNTTMASVGDIEQLRDHLEIGSWVVFGGSWGSSLSLIYAQEHPDRVEHLVLRGIFLCRRSEFEWFYQEGASHVFPDAFEPYRNHIPEGERGDLMAAYHRRLTSDDPVIRHDAAREWTRWEMATSYLIPRRPPNSKRMIWSSQWPSHGSNAITSSTGSSSRRITSSVMLTSSLRCPCTLSKDAMMSSALSGALGT